MSQCALIAPAIPRAVARRELEALQSQLDWLDNQVREVPRRQTEGPGNAQWATWLHEHVSEVVTAFGEKGVSAQSAANAVVREVRAYQTSDAALGPLLAVLWALPLAPALALALAVWLRQREASFTCAQLTPQWRRDRARARTKRLVQTRPRH